MKTVLCGLLVLAGVASSAASDRFKVSNNLDAGPGSFRQAILDANASGGGKIVFHKFNGIIALQSPLPAFTSPITVIGAGAAELAVQQGARSFPFLMNVAGNTAEISGLTISGRVSLGNAMLGSAIMNFGGLELKDCDFSGGFSVNVASAIYNTGSMSLRHCTFSGCRGNQGGAICNLGAMNLVRCTLTGNSVAGSGGAIYNDGLLDLDDCVFEYNGYFISGAGGAIYNDDDGTVALRDCSVTENRGVAGGGIWNSGSLTVTNCTLAENHATYSGGPCPGGAVYNDRNATAVLQDTIVRDNTALDLGGGIFNQGALWLLDCSIVTNVVETSEGPGQGGGVWTAGMMHAQNTIIAGNTAEQGPDVFGP